MFNPRAVLFALFSFSIIGCGSQSGDAPVFQKAEGYPCTGQVIDQEYVVRFRDGSTEVVYAKDDETFLKEFFEPNKDSIQSAEPNYRIHLEDKVEGSWSQTPSYDNWGAASIQADSYWSQDIRGENIIVAVIDTGVDVEHDKLRNQIYQNSGEMGQDGSGQDKRFNGIDDDANGYVDDWRGYDFFNNSALIRDNKDHGTHVSGIIVAEHNSSVAGPSSKVQGIAPKSKLMPVAFMGPNGSGTIDGAIAAISYAAKQGAHIINASWGGSGCSITLRQEVRALADKNVLFVAAAGNRGADLNTFPEYPASFEGLTQITVGSIDSNLKRSDFSNYSSRFVHIFAPGGAITSTIPNNGYASFNGTSMASPFVAGAAALLWSQNPTLSALEIKNKLLAFVGIQPDYQNQTSGRLMLGVQ